MKSLIITGLSSLVLGSFFAPINANEMMAVDSTVEPTNPPSSVTSPGRELGGGLSPINLVSHGRGGTFREQGIPSHVRFSLGIKSGQIDAESLVSAAIEAGRLSSEAINNSTYLSRVEFELSQLDND